MRVAPPVQAVSCSAGPWRSLQQVLYSTTGVVSTYWVGSHLGGGPWLALASLVVGLGVAAWAARSAGQPPRQLAWDGAIWAVHSPKSEPRSGQVTLMFDLGNWMLVRFVPGLPHAGARLAPQWLPLSARDAGGSWQALRVALYARQASDADPAVRTRHIDAT